MNGKRKNKKRIVMIILTLCFIFLATIFVWCYFMTQAINAQSTELSEFIIQKGASTARIVKDLKSKNFIRSEKLAYYIARIFKIPFQSGSYQLSQNMSLKEILKELTTGKQRSIKFTIAEGLTLSKLAAALEKGNIVSAAEFLSAAQSGELLKAYGVTANSCEGFLFPDTYFFTEDETPESVLNLLLKTFFEKTKGIKNFPSDATQILDTVKLASIVEREYRLESEAPTIAGVFCNRLKINMALQSCTTIEYIITEIQHKGHPTRIFLTDLEIDNPYNTYIYRGLPPTPICSPGLVALEAACNPEKHEYLYFRLINEETGQHSFSKTFSEHTRKGEGLKTKGY